MKDQIMLKSFLSVVLLIIGIATINATSYPNDNNWDFLGTKNIGHHYDKDVIYVRSSRVLYSSIEVRTDRPNVNLHRCVIYFRDGSKQRVELRRDRRGGEAHFIDLNGGARAIDKIEIIGSRDYGKVLRVFDKGTVEFWGKLADNRAYSNSRYGDDYNYRGDNYRNDDYRNDDYYRQQRAQELAQLERERRLRERARAQRERERAERERYRRGSVCPSRGW